jgi:hypothetical protein
MFCDLVDSTGIAAKLDAEEWRDLIGAYIEAASAAVVEMGGKVAKKLGDGLMALFGHPVAQENDAERAVRAGLAIQRSLAELNRKHVSSNKPALAARIAIDLGPVVVDATGEIFGDVPHLSRFGNNGCTLGGDRGQSSRAADHRQDDHRNILLEMGREGKFTAKSGGWDENRVLLEDDKLEVAVKKRPLGDDPSASLPPPEPPPVEHYFPME